MEAVDHLCLNGVGEYKERRNLNLVTYAQSFFNLVAMLVFARKH